MRLSSVPDVNGALVFKPVNDNAQHKLADVLTRQQGSLLHV